MTRYFMTIPEASRLVIQAGALGRSGEIFALDMGEPVKIVDLAKNLIELSGHKLEDIPIEFTGLRPGEKLHEEIYSDDEIGEYIFEKITLVKNSFILDNLEQQLQQLTQVKDDELFKKMLIEMANKRFHLGER